MISSGNNHLITSLAMSKQNTLQHNSSNNSTVQLRSKTNHSSYSTLPQAITKEHKKEKTQPLDTNCILYYGMLYFCDTWLMKHFLGAALWLDYEW